MQEKTAFEIGLVLSGAVSAGAYSSGVIDFLIEALDNWYQQKQIQQQLHGDDYSQWEIPCHDVIIKAISGTSAGAVTAAIATAALYDEIIPVTQDPKEQPVKNNKFYESWVQKIDISQLLKSQDLANPQAPLLSVLDSSILDTIGKNVINNVINNKKPLKQRPYLADPLQVYMCVTNLRGVPYLVSTQGADPNIKGHRMIHHADYMQFALGTNTESESNAILLNPNGSNVNAWQLMVDAALASSAYPVGLAPRNLVRTSIKEYEKHQWKVPTLISTGQCYTYRSIAPDISLVGTGPYEFVAVDGGTVNNEPIELVRGLLRDGEQQNPREPQQAKRATVLIDPFPNDVAVENPKYDLLNIVMRLFYSLMANARFKPEELILAQDEDIYSRFLISPVRDGNRLSPLACGSVRAFGGFLHQSFRHHDYILGRRNCQKFLKDYFVLSPSNSLFNCWPETLKNHPKWQVRKQDQDNPYFLPIIPLVGSAAKEVPLAEWPQYPQEQLDSLENQIKARFQDAFPRLIKQLPLNGVFRNLLNVLWLFQRGQLIKGIRNYIEEDLRKHGQL
ncbi:patatin-like phospholipase family protein [Nostoc sp. FACHB-152]|uniref:patatin-like phospholipase family protein n=1 Tax=unclassified Nostoc TaxID=2593658 RepID=UPI001687FABF|nr:MULTISPECIES: patatin-like phospholipase family protein [unclassified Nostoc]MBD2446627.1 patatin-like phospholipase family protein [Nostoc sp. FACHB-152]MBD2466475.1 patatin-like phospholipase family protein [Nostoc sp. FACHB-145]